MEGGYETGFYPSKATSLSQSHCTWTIRWTLNQTDWVQMLDKHRPTFWSWMGCIFESQVLLKIIFKKNRILKNIISFKWDKVDLLKINK